MVVRAWAPYRVMDLGGWTDCEFIPQGAVTSVAISLGVHVYLETGKVPGGGLTLSVDGAVVTGPWAHVMETATGPHGLLTAAVERVGTRWPGGMYLETSGALPVGSGVGGSATTAVATLTALYAVAGKRPWHGRVAEDAHAVEVEDLGLSSGIQDQWAAVLGEVNHLRVAYPRMVHAERISLRPVTRRELERRLVICDVGGPRLSSDIHGQVRARWAEGKPEVRAAIHSLRICADEGARLLAQGDLTQLGPLLDANWQAQKALSPAVTTPEIDQVVAIAEAFGGHAKANGAGGGGTVSILAAENRVGALKHALDSAGFRSYAVGVAQHGAEAW